MQVNVSICDFLGEWGVIQLLTLEVIMFVQGEIISLMQITHPSCLYYGDISGQEVFSKFQF